VSARYTRTADSVLGAVLIAAMLLMTGCGGDGDGQPAPGAGAVSLIKSGKIVTCTHLPYEPFQFEQGGKTVGFDVDLVDLVAKRLGVQQEIFDTPFEGIQSGEALNARKCDIAAAAMTITPERSQKILFSDPYFDADQALLVKKGSGIDSFDDLKGKLLGVQTATTGKAYAEQNAVPTGVKIKDYEDLALELKSVQTGGVAAAINDIPVLLDFAKKNADVEVTATFKTNEKYGFGMKKAGSEELAKIVNEVIAKAKQDGTYTNIYKKWFGVEPKA
jgi:polar amino acid transport system substrate-binding protein